MAKTKMTTEDLLGVFEEMSVLELSEFLKAFEEKFDVTAAAPMAMAVAAPGAAGGEVAEEEQDEFDVVLTEGALAPGANQRQGSRRGGQSPARGSRRHRRAQVELPTSNMTVLPASACGYGSV